MKKVKRIIAGMAAAVMAFSTMSIGASAYTENYDVHKNSQDVVNVFQRTVRTTKSNPTITISYYHRYASKGYLRVSNTFSSSYIWSYNYSINSPLPINYTIPWQALGTNVGIKAELVNNEAYGIYESEGVFDG